MAHRPRLRRLTPRRRLMALAIVATLVSLRQSPARAARAIPDDNLAYPVLITVLPIGDTASGFYLNTGNSIFFVTSRHVLFADDGTMRGASATLLSYPKNINDKGHIVLTLDLKKLSEGQYIRRHKSQDVAVIFIGANAPRGEANAFVATFIDGVLLTEKTESGMLSVGMGTVRRFDEVLTGDDVFVFGYPTSLGLKSDPTRPPQFDPHTPLLRKGIVAGKNGDLHTLILDAPTYFGNSGGPALEVEQDGLNKKFHVIGVVSEFIPLEEASRTFHTWINSGYSVAVGMDAVLELTKE